MTRTRIAARAVSLGAAAAVAVGFGFAGTSHADTFVPLPGGEIVRSFADGTVVTVRLTDESALISPSMGATGLHRNVWVSGTASAEISGPGAKGGGITPGYLVACQWTIGGGAGAGLDSNGDPIAGAPGMLGQIPAPNQAGNVTIGPGQAQSFNLLDIESEDDFGGESHSGENKFTGSSGSVTYVDSTMAVNGCAGFAQARAYVKVKVSTDTLSSTVTLWGQPFSIG